MKKNLLKLLAIIALCPLSIAAQENDQQEKAYFPAQLSFVYPIGTSFTQSTNYTYSVSLNMISGAIGGLDGLEMSGIAGIINGEAKGIQMAGIAGIVRNDFQGIQMCGIFGGVGGNMNGSQMNGIGSLVAKDFFGLQMSGIFNVANGEMRGSQLSGIANVAKEVKGLQMAGILNKAEVLRSGVQLALINVVDSVASGTPIGLLSFVKHGGFSQIELFSSDVVTAGLNYRMGVEHFYSILSAGLNVFHTDPLLSFGFGFGSRIALDKQKTLAIQPEIIGHSFQTTDFDKWANISQLKLMLSLQISEKFGVTAGPTLSYSNLTRENIFHDEIALLEPFGFYKSQGTEYSVSLGYHLGLNYRFR